MLVSYYNGHKAEAGFRGLFLPTVGDWLKRIWRPMKKGGGEQMDSVLEIFTNCR